MKTLASGSIAAGGYVTRTQQVTLPVTGLTGDVFLMAFVDSQNSILEENETNNIAFSTGTMHLPAQLTLSLPVSQIAENAANPNISASISRNGDVSDPLSVLVISSDFARLSAPGIVTIPAGQSTAGFNLTVHPDGVISTNKLVTITMSAPGFIGSTGAVTVLNTDLPKLSMSVVYPSIVEGGATAVFLSRISLPRRRWR